MAVSVVRQGAVYGELNSNHVSPVGPTGVATGNLLLAIEGTSKGSQITFTDASGLPSITGCDTSSGSNSSDTRQHWYGKVAASADAGLAYRINNSPFTDGTAAFYEFAGVDVSAFPGTLTSIFDAAVVTAATVNSVTGPTTVSNGCGIVVAITLGTTQTMTTGPTCSSGLTLSLVGVAQADSTAPTTYVYFGQQAAAGAVGTISWTPTGTGSNSGCIVAALKPAASGGGVVPRPPVIPTSAVTRASRW
jgi:hypothetical protein